MRSSHGGTMTSRRELLSPSPSGISQPEAAKKVERSWSKCCSVFFNSMLLLVAFLTGGASLWVWTEVNNLPAMEGILLAMGPVFKVTLVAPAAECVVAMIGVFFGLYGVHYRRRNILFLHFSLILVCSLVAVIFTITTAYRLIVPESLEQNIERMIDDMYGVYGHDDVTADIDILQVELTCCGSASYASWADSEWLNLQRLAHFKGEEVPSLPPSCCQLYPNSTRGVLHPINPKACQGLDVSLPNMFMYQKGCASDVMAYVFPFLLVLVCSQICLFIMEIFVIVSTVVILRHIRSEDPVMLNETEYIAKLYNSIYQKYGGNVSLNIHQKGVTEQIRVYTPVAFANLVYTDMFDENAVATSRL